jgi:hypothetical protein
MTRQGLIDAVEQLANGIGGDVTNSPFADSEMTVEDLLPHAARYAAKLLMRSGSAGMQDVGRSHTIPLSLSGAFYKGPLPSAVLTEYMDEAFLPDYEKATFVDSILDLKRQKFTNLLSYWTVHNEELYFTKQTANLALFAASVPDLPNDLATTIVMTDDFRDKWIEVLVAALRGEIKLGV